MLNTAVAITDQIITKHTEYACVNITLYRTTLHVSAYTSKDEALGIITR